jgi:LPXTG-motif cell wall-anchored protein
LMSKEGISRGQQDEPPSEIAESSGVPEETVGATLSVVEEHGGVKAQTDARSPSAQVSSVAGVAPEATTGPFVATSRVECANTAAPPPVTPSADKALPQAGGADVTSLLALATGSLLVGGGLLAFRFTRAARH